MRVRPFIIILGLAGVAGCDPGAPRPNPAAPPRPVAAVELPTELPPRLSQTGLLADLAAVRPATGFIPYELNVPFWSDGATKRRWVSVPEGKRIHFTAEGDWAFPAGTVFLKHFEVGTHRLETRVLVCDGDGIVHGASYKWRADGSDADVVDEPLVERVSDDRTWYFPGRADCVVCHTRVSGGVLGVKTRQLNRAAGHQGENQLAMLNRLGVLDAHADPAKLPRLAAHDDSSRSIEDRARSYLDANCAHCHRPGGVAGNFDARYDTPLARQNLIEGPVLIDMGLDHARVIAPADPWRSIGLIRVETTDQTRMPPLAHQLVDRDGASVLREWIASLPGTPVLSPPVIETRGGEYRSTVRVTLKHDDPGAAIHYTLDGGAPGKSSPVYEHPIELTEPATLRARAYKDGMTRSIAVQETFIVR